jgi:lipoate-protein ligase B
MGQMPYQQAWNLQRDVHGRVASGEMTDTLLLLEHPHVYTLGRRGKEVDILVSPERLRELGAEVHFIDRGGEATYHGPGQIVGYPIVNLRKRHIGPLRYVQTIEQTLISTLSEFGIKGESVDRPTGVWVGDAKIAAIGVRISRGVTMHGFALNVSPDLTYFDHIVPCGLPGSGVTSIARELSKDVTVEQVMPVVAHEFGEAFGMDMAWHPAEDIQDFLIAQI